MALSTSTSRKRSIMAEINVTPLTDVFLVLLIIFMITTSAMMKPENVDLPKSSAEEQEQKGVMVTMTPSHEVYVNDRPVGGATTARSPACSRTRSPRPPRRW